MHLLNGIRNAFDRLALYLPALVMSLFALGSWWLVRSVPEMDNPRSAKAVRKEPDYFLHGFSVKSFDPSGRLTRELEGAHARHYPEFDVLDIDTVQIHAIDAQGQRLVARADKAQAQGENTHQEAKVILTGNANVVRDSTQGGVSTELRSEKIIAFTPTRRVISEAPVEVIRGKDIFTANTMDLNGESGEYKLEGRVRGVIQPATRTR